MKKIILFISLSLLCACGYAQQFYKVNAGFTKNDLMKLSSATNVQITFTPITYSQLNFVTSFDMVSLNSGKWSVSASTLSFTPSFVFGAANAKITATAAGNIYNLSQNVAYGGGLNVSYDIVTGQPDIAPSAVAQVGATWAATLGWGVNRKRIEGGVSAQLGDILNNLNHIVQKNL